MKKRADFRLQRSWRQLSIQNQIFIAMFLIIVLAVGTLVSFVYWRSVSTIEENYRASYASTLSNSSRVINMNLRSIIEGERAFLNNSDFRQVMENGASYGGHQFSTGDQEMLKEVANDLASQETWVNYIVFVDLYGHYYLLNNISRGTYSFYEYYENLDAAEEEWQKDVREAKGKEVFYGNNILGEAYGDGFSLAKYMINPSTTQPMGYMVIGLSRKLLARSFVISSGGYDSSNFMVVDDSGDPEIVYFVGNEEQKADILEAYADPEQNESYLISSVKNTTTGWNVVNVVEKNELSEESKQIRMAAVLMAGAVLFGCFWLARLISRSITRPLKQLETAIARVGGGERHITEEFDYSEVGRIGRKFTEMVNTNLELSEHLMAVKLNEQEAKLLLLQSQINPHYLYNTLDSLYFVAIMHGDDQMAEMLEALSDNFKLSLNNGAKYITVSDSVRWLSGYMKLLNLRYNHRFELFVDIRREILPRKTITFIFQPFIENAVYHGLEPKIGKGRISLKGSLKGNDMVFVIEDDGVGIEDMSMLEKGYGIRNVRERIRLNYGETYGVSIESKKGEGTRVTIVVPVR